MGSMTTFGAFTAARLGMYASMKGLDVTGHNIANINTKGYTRQVLDQRALKLDGADRYYSIYDARVGSGVLTTGISQLRDPYLDIRYRNESASVGYADAKLGILDSLSNVLDEIAKNVDGDGVLEKQLSDLLSKLDTLNQGVGQQENDTLVKESASTLVSLFKSYAAKLKGVENDNATLFKEDLTKVNSILTNIRNLNDNIRDAEIHGDSALELRDQRNLLLDDLSQYVKIDVSYEKEDLGAGITVQKLVVKLADQNKTPLVDGSHSAQIKMEKPEPDPNSATSGFLYLKPDGTGTNDPSEAARIPSADYDLDVGVLTDRNGTPLPGSKPTQLGQDINGSLQASRQMLTSAGEYGNPPTEMRGIPYYRKALDSLANKFATVMNDANRPYQVDDAGNYLDAAGDILTNPPGDPTGTKLNKNNDLSAADKAIIEAADNRVGGILFSTNNGDPTDPTAGITAENISISHSWSSNATRITASAIKGAPSTKNDNIMHIINCFTKSYDYLPSDIVAGASNTSMFSGNFQQMLGGINATLANDVSATTTVLMEYATTSNSIANSRDSISSVDLNDEAANMMQYQKSYAAACRLMTTIDEALDKLINGTGVVGR